MKNIERAGAVRSAVKRIAEIEENLGTTRQMLEMIKAELIALAATPEWFAADEFPPPEPGGADNSCVYRICEEPDTHRRALYIQSVRSPLDVPPHNHDTWAVIVGIHGGELNRLYERTEDGVRQTGECLVETGKGVALLPDDLHSIHIHDDEPVVNFHMYGLGLEYLIDRTYFDRKTGQWTLFPVDADIIDAGYVAG